VRAAINRGVDIISMSWTIERTPDNGADIDKLEATLDEAAKNNILLFCSANDQATETDDSYPATNPMRFKIGAATAEGTAWRWTRASHVDFIFPGDNVVKDRPGNVPLDKCSVVSGSSVATALAVGLAALVLHCVQFSVYHRNAANQQVSDVALKDFHAMKTRKRMAEAFQAIYTTKDSDHKYIEVWNTFETAPREAEGKEKGVKRNIIATVADKLRSKKKLDFEF
jgi:subtilisin family serine protease